MWNVRASGFGLITSMWYSCWINPALRRAAALCQSNAGDYQDFPDLSRPDDTKTIGFIGPIGYSEPGVLTGMAENDSFSRSAGPIWETPRNRVGAYP